MLLVGTYWQRLEKPAGPHMKRTKHSRLQLQDGHTSARLPNYLPLAINLCDRKHCTSHPSQCHHLHSTAVKQCWGRLRGNWAGFHFDLPGKDVLLALAEKNARCKRIPCHQWVLGRGVKLSCYWCVQSCVTLKQNKIYNAYTNGTFSVLHSVSHTHTL